MDDLLGNIIAGIIQVVPLLAIPFILKGIVDGVPVLGNALNKGFNRASGFASKQADKSGWAAERRAKYNAGKINGIGLKRSDAARARSRTFGQFMGDRERRYKKSISGLEKSAENQFDTRTREDARRLEEFQPSSRKWQRGMENVAWSGARKRVNAQEQLEDEEAIYAANHAGYKADGDRRAQANPNSAIGRARRSALEYGYESAGANASVKEEVERRALANPNSLAGAGIRERQRAEALNAEVNAGFGAQLDAEKRDSLSTVGQSERRRLAFVDNSTTDQKAVSDSFEQARANPESIHGKLVARAGVDTAKLAQNAIEQQARDQSLALSKGVQRQNYANALDPDSRTYDQTILNVAGGTVTPTGKIQAQAFGVQAIQKASQEQVSAARVLGGNNGEAAYANGIRYNATTGNLEYHQDVFDASGNVTGTNVITDEAGVLAGLKAAKVIGPDARSTAEFTAAGRKSLQYIQGFGNTTFGAEAIAANLATTAQLDGNSLETIFRNVTFDPSVSAADQNFELSELVTRVNEEARKAGFDFLSKNTIDQNGKFILGGMKGGVGGVKLKRGDSGNVIFDEDGMAQFSYQGLVGQVIDEKGIGGYTKYLMGDESTRGEAAMVAYMKMMKSPGSFDAGLPQLTDKVKSQLVEQISNIMTSDDPQYAGLRQTIQDAGMALPISEAAFKAELDERQRNAILRKEKVTAPGTDQTAAGESATGQKPAEGANADGDDTTDNSRDSGDIV